MSTPPNLIRLDPAFRVLLPEGATGGSGTLTYEGEYRVAALLAGAATDFALDIPDAALPRLARPRSLAGGDLYFLAAREGDPEPPYLTLRVYPTFPAVGNVVATGDPITYSGRPHEYPAGSGLWDLRDLGGDDRPVLLSRQSAADLKGQAETALTASTQQQQQVAQAVAGAGQVGAQVTQQQQTNNAQAATVLGRLTAATVAAIGMTVGLYNITGSADAGQVWERPAGGAAAVRRPELEAASVPQLTAVRSALGNLALSELTARRQSDGPQFVDGSRWVWRSAAMMGDLQPDGGTLIRAADGGLWDREWRDRVYARWYGIVGDGTTNERAAIVAAAQAARARRATLHLEATAGGYYVGAGLTMSAGDNLRLSLAEDAVLLADNAGASIVRFEDVGRNFSLRGGSYQYKTQPTARGNFAAVHVQGSAMVNVKLADLSIPISGNFGIWCIGVLAPGASTVTGCKKLSITGCDVAFSFGDGIHVENIDRAVTVSGNTVEAAGDDSIAINNSTNPNFPHAHPTPTYEVHVRGNTIINPTFGAVRIGGAVNYEVTGNIITGGSRSTGSNCYAFPCSLDKDYGPLNRNGLYQGNVVDGVYGLGFVVSADGTRQQNIRYLDNLATNLYGPGSYVDGKSAADGLCAGIEFRGNRYSAAAGNSSNALTAAQVAGLVVRDNRWTGYVRGVTVLDSLDVELDTLRVDKPAGRVGGGAAYDLLNLTGLRLRGLLSRKQGGDGFETGLRLRSSNGIRAEGGCMFEVVNALDLSGLGVDTEGWLDEVQGKQSFGTIGSATVKTLTWRRPIIGREVNVAGELEGGSSNFWVIRNPSLTGAELVMGDRQDVPIGAYHYRVRGLLTPG